MAFEFLDLENKLYQPTQALLDVMLNNIGNGYIWLKQALISAHSTVAKLGIEWYDEPIETSISWYEMGIQSSQNLYSRFINDLIPRAEAKQEEIISAASQHGNDAQNTINYIIENPELVTAETIESLTDTLTKTSNASTELLTELQEKSAEIISIMLEQPLQTLDSAYVELLSYLLDSYYLLVSSILTSL